MYSSFRSKVTKPQEITSTIDLLVICLVFVSHILSQFLENIFFKLGQAEELCIPSNKINLHYIIIYSSLGL